MAATGQESHVIAEELSTSKKDVGTKDLWDGCLKNPGHRDLVPWIHFLSDPQKYFLGANISDDEVTKSYIKAVGELTVMLWMRYASPERTKLYSSMYKFRGNAHSFFGSGLVVYDVEESENKCRCSRCYPLKIEKPPAWKVFVATATHVVLDGREAETLIAELYYHDLKDRKTVKKLYGVGICERSILGDCCVVECCTCDRLLAEELRRLLSSQNELFQQLPQRCKTGMRKSAAVIISHPHGMPKHISFGECVGKDVKKSEIFRLSAMKYNTATCPGSSGAPALCLSDRFKARGSRFLVTNLHLHSGAGSAGNFSNITRQPTLHRNSQGGLVKEIQASIPSSNVNTKKDDFHGSAFHGKRMHPKDYFPPCAKNPRHENFIPIKSLKLNDLPEDYRDVDVLNFIQTLSKLTCLIRVQQISPMRPSDYPGFNEPNLPSGDRSSGHLLGTGFFLFTCTQDISNIVCCPCRFCEGLKTPNEEFIVLYIRTANTVVFDNIEAKGAVVTLGEQKLNVVKVISNKVDQDWSIIQCVTHQVDLHQKFKSYQENVQKLDKIIRYRYSNEVHKLSIIVSHPHGHQNKHVTFGEFTGKQWSECNEDTDLENYTYSTPTCPGCSGAPVVILGQGVPRINEHYITCHIHSDALEDCNKSGYVIDSLL